MNDLDLPTQLVDLQPDETLRPAAGQVAEASTLEPGTLQTEQVVVVALACEDRIVHVVMPVAAAGILAIELAERVSALLNSD